MSQNRADMSHEAHALFIELTEAGVTRPDAGDMPAFREQVRAGFEPYVKQALQAFDGEIEDVRIGGIGCKQVTPTGWRQDSGGCIQYAYGGGYVCDSPYEDLVIAAPLAQASGARIVMVDYRLSPEFPYPEPQRDMQAVYPELLASYGAPRLAVAGESAGGNQALALLQQIRNDGLEAPRCAALVIVATSGCSGASTM